MLLSKHWLRDFVFLPDSLDAKVLAEQLCLSTVEVEKVIDQAEHFANIVVGTIQDIQTHPNADKLKICLVDVGNETLSIVCGGSNIMKGQKVAVAKIGAKVRWHGEGELITMERASIRGVESMGMICASDEIGLTDRFPKKDTKEILDLSHLDVKTGESLASALGFDDVVFDIDNKSMTNRPDLWGHYGLAREIAALTRKKFIAMKPARIKPGREWNITAKVSAPNLCPRYMAVVVSGLSAASSPSWMVRRLETAGLRSINAIVDLTNYVMLELGQPLHAFDADVLRKEISGKKSVALVVREAEDQELFTTLDNKEYHLQKGMVVIANHEKALAIAGVKGGKDSGVTESTNTVIFEAATFDAHTIRQTATLLNLRTDSSTRFEKSLDPELPELALCRVVELAKKVFPKSHVVSTIVDSKNFSSQTKYLSVSVSFINERLGLNLDKKVMITILERLGFDVHIKKDILKVMIPSWRATKDITIAEDIVEEIARVYGYENIPSTLPRGIMAPPEVNHARTLEREVKELLAFQAGLTEVSNYSFVSPLWLYKLGLFKETYWELDNPIAQDRPLLRAALIPGLLENVQNNCHWSETIRLFEIGRVFCAGQSGERVKPNSDALLPQQPLHLGIVIAEKSTTTPFYTAAYCVRIIAERLGYSIRIQSTQNTTIIAHPSRQADITSNGHIIGTISELHPRLQQEIGIGPRVALVELSLSDLLKQPRESLQYQPIAEFPAVKRDIAFVVDRTASHQDIESTMLSTDPLIFKTELFDVYEGSHVPRGKKSLAYHITYQAHNQTLTSEMVDAVHNKVESVLKKQYKADVRR